MADPVTLGVIGGAALLALRKKGQAEAPAPSPPPTNLARMPANDPAQTVAAVAAGITAVMGTASGVVSTLSGAGAALSTLAPSAATLGTVGAVLGTVTTVAAGVAAVFGAFLLGQALDRLFGGDGTGIRGTVLGTGLAAATAGTIVSAMLGGAAAATPVGLVLVLVAAVTYLFVAAFEDADRLVNGPRRAVELFVKTWDENFRSIRGQLERISYQGVEDGRLRAALSDELLNRAAAHSADGFMAEWNTANYRNWMARPFGLGMSRANHAAYGLARGYFLGSGEGLGGTIGASMTNPGLTPEGSLNTVEVRAPVPRGEWPTYSVDAARQGTTFRRGTAACPPVFVPLTDQLPNGTDNQRARLFEAGRQMANLTAYCKWMLEPSSFGAVANFYLGVNERGAHARHGLAQGLFVGQVSDFGELIYAGKIWGQSGARQAAITVEVKR